MPANELTPNQLGELIKNRLYAKNVIVQGITGNQGAFHTQAMLSYGTNIIAGTSPNTKEKLVHGVKVYQKLSQITERIDATVIFVPAPHAKGAILEAIAAKIPLIVCITENIPLHDMLQIKNNLAKTDITFLGPNTPGVLVPGVNKLGIIPGNLALTGQIGIVSRSGTLTYEAMDGLTKRGLGQKYIIGIGGDPIKGSGYTDYLALFQADSDIKKIVLIGEIGGQEELAAANYIRHHITKPVYGYIAGHYAPQGVRLGHAGAILGSEKESAAYKTEALTRAGVNTASSISELIELV